MSSARRAQRHFPALLSGLGLLTGFLVARLSGAVHERDTTPLQVVRSEVRRRPPLPTKRRSAVLHFRRGEPGSGGYYGAWADANDAGIVRHIEFQYEGREHQAETALSGMWLFLATELVFFGGLFLLYMVYRFKHPDGIAEGSRQTELWIGTVNSVLLLTSSAVFSYGLGRIKEGDNRRLFSRQVWAFGKGANRGGGPWLRQSSTCGSVSMIGACAACSAIRAMASTVCSAVCSASAPTRSASRRAGGSAWATPTATRRTRRWSTSCWRRRCATGTHSIFRGHCSDGRDCGRRQPVSTQVAHMELHRDRFINFRERAPLKATPGIYLDASGNVVSGRSTRGYLAVAVPGTVAGLEKARESYGTRTRAR